jgi:hypothetical protein
VKPMRKENSMPFRLVAKMFISQNGFGGVMCNYFVLEHGAG